MPNVWEALQRLKTRHGAAHVAECVRRGVAGEPNWFYAFEAGHIVGTPFTVDKYLNDWLQVGAALGGKHAVVIRPPEGEKSNGA